MLVIHLSLLFSLEFMCSSYCLFVYGPDYIYGREARQQRQHGALHPPLRAARALAVSVEQGVTPVDVQPTATLTTRWICCTPVR